MYNVNNSIYNWFNNTAASGGSASASGIGGTDFSKLLENIGGNGGDNSTGSLLDYLSRRFPSANFSEGSVGESAKDVQDYFGTGEGDNVAVESAAAEAIASNSTLAKMFENMMAAFQNTAGQTQAAEGAYLQRNIMVTSVTIRFSISQIDGQSGETLSMNELKAAFSEKLQELAQKFFGNAKAEDAEAADETKDIDIVAEKPQDTDAKTTNPYAAFFGGSMSFSMYFSAGYFSSQSAAAAAGDEADYSAKDFQAAFAAQGNFQKYANSTFSYAIFSGLMSSGLGSGPFTSMLDKGMDMFGMSSQSSWQQDGGFYVKFAESRSLISELMSLYSSSAAGSLSVTSADAAEPKATEPTAETAAETAAV